MTFTIFRSTGKARVLLGLAPFLSICLLSATAAFGQQNRTNTRVEEKDEGRVRLSTGVDYSSGDYGGDVKTKILYVPFSAQYQKDRWRLRVTVPYIRVQGPGAVVGGGDGPIVVNPGRGMAPPFQEPQPPEPTPTEEPTIVTNSGVGDIYLQASYLVLEERDVPYVELTAKVKLPTASDSKFLGTGKTDFYVQADIFQSFGNVTPFASIGYRFPGDPPGLNLRNTLYATGGAAVKTSQQFTIGGLMYYRQASVAGSAARLEAIPYATVKFTDNWALNFYGLFGLKDGSPDAGGGAALRLYY